MQILTGTLANNPPASLEARFSPTAQGMPLLYWDATLLGPQEATLCPTSPAETFDFTALRETPLAYASGYSTISPSTTAQVYDADYAARFSTEAAPVRLKTPTIKGNLVLKNPTDAIHLLGVQADSSEAWCARVKQGHVWQDHIVSQAELYHAGAPASGESAVDFYSQSWLAAAGFLAGDKVRLFYTIPPGFSEGAVMDYEDARCFEIKGALASHIGEGRIAAEHPYVRAINRLEDPDFGALITSPVSGNADVGTGLVRAWDTESGEFTLTPAPDDGTFLSANAVMESRGLVYRGFWDEGVGLWQGLDLNPAPGHFYNGGVDVSGSPVDLPSAQLLYRSVTFYLLPSAALKLNSDGTVAYPLQYYTAYIQGLKDQTWCPVRHYVPKEAKGAEQGGPTRNQTASWGYAVLDKDVYAEESGYSAADRGIPKELQSALLLGSVGVLASYRGEALEARRFSGLAGDQTDVQIPRWDLESWDGPNISVAGAALVEIDPSVIAEYGYDVIEQRTREAMPPGVVPIIQPRTF